MPISPNVLVPRTAEAGKIKIGQVGAKRKSENGKEFSQPRKLESKEGPYFIITKTIRGTGDDQNFLPDLALMKELEQYADHDSDGHRRLRKIPIMLDSDSVDEVAPHYLALYRGTSLFCSGTGDGKDAATRWIDGNPKKFDCPCDLLRASQGCKPNLILWLTIVAGTETRLGVRHAFRTTGWNSIKSILASLKTIQAQVGTICGIKLWLCVKWDLKKDGSGKTRRIPVVYLECRTNDLMKLRREAIVSARARLEVIQLQNPTALALPAPAQGESKSAQAAVAAEWYPSCEDVEDDEDDEIYNPDTGEIYASGDHVDSPDVENQDPPEFDPDAILPESHPVREVMKNRLTEVARFRNFSDDDLAQGRKEIWAEACEAAALPRLPWGALTMARAQRIEQKLCEMINIEP